MDLTRIDESLLAAAYFRGGSRDDPRWHANCAQVLTLSLFYTGDVTAEDCVERFSVRPYLRGVYEDGLLTEPIVARYAALISLLRKHPELIEGNGNFEHPAEPVYTACRLTPDGVTLALSLIPIFPRKPDFPNWPDNRTFAPSL